MPKYGQHFLRSPEILERETTLAVPKGKIIAELGAGDGRVVHLLLSKGAKKVLAIEKDPFFAALLRSRFPKEKVEVIEENILNVPLHCDGVVGNIPYYLSRPLLKHLTQQTFRYGVLILQKEMVDKILAQPGQSNYRAISVLMQCAFHIRRICKVGRGCFEPPPRVDSAMILIRRKRTLTPQFIKNVEVLFTQRNKKQASLQNQRPRQMPAEEIYNLLVGEQENENRD